MRTSASTYWAARRICGVLLCLFGTVFANAASALSESDFHAWVVALYSFEPHTLKTTELNAKSDELDKFWTLVQSDPAGYLPLLRKELVNPSPFTFFYYDGSKLLLSLSKDREDQLLALRSMPKADLVNVQSADYLKTVQRLSSTGLDTREAAFRILAYPDFSAFIPAHALKLGQDYSLIYMLFPMRETAFVEDLVQHLSDEKSAQSLKSLLLALWYTMTPAGQAAIKGFAQDERNPSEVRQYASRLLSVRAPATGGALPNAEGLREERRQVMRRPISDEALQEFEVISAKIAGWQ